MDNEPSLTNLTWQTDTALNLSQINSSWQSAKAEFLSLASKNDLSVAFTIPVPLDAATRWAPLAVAQQNTSELSLLSEHVHLTNTREKQHPFLGAILVNSYKVLLQRNYQVCCCNN